MSNSSWFSMSNKNIQLLVIELEILLSAYKREKKTVSFSNLVIAVSVSEEKKPVEFTHVL